MEMQPPEFMNVPYGEQAQAACAPHVSDPTWMGIAINTPDKIVLKAGEALQLPVCGYYALETAPLIMGAQMFVHVRNFHRPEDKPVTAEVVLAHGDNEPDAPIPGKPETPPDPSVYEGQVSDAYFYIDAQAHLPLRLPPGTYDIRVSLGEVLSNVQRVVIETQAPANPLP